MLRQAGLHHDNLTADLGPKLMSVIPTRNIPFRYGRECGAEGPAVAGCPISRVSCEKWGLSHPLRISRTTRYHHFLQNLPTPTLTCTVFSPGFAVASPAFDICRYRTSRLQLYFAPSTCVPSAAADVKFTVFVPVRTL